MMKRFFITAFVLVIFLPTAQADPFTHLWHWAGHHKRFLLMEGAAVGGAAAHAYGLHRCRRANGVEPCDEHYGAAWGGYAAFSLLTVVALPAVAEGCWKENDGARFCYALAYAGSATQASWGIHEATIRHDGEELRKYCFANCHPKDLD